MNERRSPPNRELLVDGTAIDAAVNRAAREAVLAHARAGNPVATCRNGKVEWVQPEEILAEFDPPSAKQK